MSRRRARNDHRGYSAVALYKPKTATNVGTAFRSCHLFGVALIEIVGGRFRRQHSDVTKAWRSVPHVEVDEVRVPYDCVPVAIEITDDARPLPSYTHPERALYVFGPEDGGIPKDVMRSCRDVVRIPGTDCMNLACAVTTVLYDRAAKRER